MLSPHLLRTMHKLLRHVKTRFGGAVSRRVGTRSRWSTLAAGGFFPRRLGQFDILLPQ